MTCIMKIRSVFCKDLFIILRQIIVGKSVSTSLFTNDDFRTYMSSIIKCKFDISNVDFHLVTFVLMYTPVNESRLEDTPTKISTLLL